MIDPDKRKAIYLLHETGRSTVEEIARKFQTSRNTVRTIIAQKGQVFQSERSDKKQIDPEVLRELWRQCDGWIQRMHEILTEERGFEVSYPTLTRMLREAGISQPAKEPCHRVPDEPGLEMQHDTTLYKIQIGGQLTRVVASLLYLRYSKRRYLKFYRCFERFKMKCFFHEALSFWGYSARQCIIDNTNLARLRGSGSNAVIVPEMEVFARNLGFLFRCHALKHPNRKAGEERSFYTVETNFLPGRTFTSWEDLNAQALQWATVRLENRPQGKKAGLIPAKAFEHEANFLIRLPEYLPAPYRIHSRGLDPYGYIAFDGNYYWVPQPHSGELKVLEYAGRLKIFRARECLAEYPLPAPEVKNKCFPESGPPHRPKNRHKPTQEEEKRLRGLGASVSAYLDFACAAQRDRSPQFPAATPGLVCRKSIRSQPSMPGLQRSGKRPLFQSYPSPRDRLQRARDRPIPRVPAPRRQRG